MTANQLIGMFAHNVARRAMYWGITKSLGTLSCVKTVPGKRRSNVHMQDLMHRMRSCRG